MWYLWKELLDVTSRVDLCLVENDSTARFFGGSRVVSPVRKE